MLNWRYASMDKGHDLVSSRRPIITLADDDPVYWLAYWYPGTSEIIEDSNDGRDHLVLIENIGNNFYRHIALTSML